MSVSHSLLPVRGSRGFSLIELIVAISLVAILAGIAADRLFWYQGLAEKTAMEYNATMIRSALWIESASLMIANRGAEIPALIERNPLNLLAQKPANYLGAIDGSEVQALEPGNWFYDMRKRQVVYIVAHRGGFKPTIDGDYTVRYGMQIVYGEIDVTPDEKAKYVEGATLTPLSKYTWH